MISWDVRGDFLSPDVKIGKVAPRLQYKPRLLAWLLLWVWLEEGLAFCYGESKNLT